MSGLTFVILVVCLVGNTHACKDIDGGQAENAIECMLKAEEEAAPWLDRHPGYVLDTVRCYVGDKPKLGEDT